MLRRGPGFFVRAMRQVQGRSTFPSQALRGAAATAGLSLCQARAALHTAPAAPALTPASPARPATAAAIPSSAATTPAAGLFGLALRPAAAGVPWMAQGAQVLARRHFCSTTRTLLDGAKTPEGSKPRTNNQLETVKTLEEYRERKEEEREEQREEEDPFARNSGPGYLPFPPPFHTINIVMLVLIANVLCYLIMNFGNDDWRDFLVEHFTMSHENFHRIYPIFTNALYQENLLQLLIDSWLLWQFGDTLLGFLGNARLTFFMMLCTLGGSLIHVARQRFELHYGMDELEVRGRCYGCNPFIMGCISIEGLIFRHLNFIAQPPVPFIVLTAFIIVIDVWRIFTTKPEEHGAATGGAIMAVVFWALPIRFMGLDKLTAAI